MLKKTQGVGPIRKVVLVKDDHEGLGISITVSHSHSCFFPSLSVPVKACHPVFHGDVLENLEIKVNDSYNAGRGYQMLKSM